MCTFSSKSGGVPFQPLGDLTWNDPAKLLSNLSAPVPCVLSNFRCKLVKSNSSIKIIITDSDSDFD